ncbi:DUF928 domain-containing protein [Oscillatoria sp. FACHB-1406]|uniref:DUF928 domain-containing protein n=1 Tax=Oscillatoria sp. FACHB-1406 TaxID=2692846 RepID=UPI001689CB53|nr:DUF928 domain-containing protein [Oscillatoria sp. FACHB-1406]MBD2578840.1 DUF928 domain-containing protein [Oscillatoria sp. FACHB-1406]
MTIHKSRFTHPKIILLALAGAVAFGISLPTLAVGQTLSRETSGSIQFKPPRDAAPRDTYGGGIRGNIRFIPPRTTTPERTTGGGARGELVFADPAALHFRPPRNPSPERTVGSGIRGNLSQDIVPLLPETNSGYTASARPTIYLYVPPTSARQVFFSLQDENFTPQYQTVLNISGEGGIVSVTLPEDAPELEVGKFYAWFFAPIENGSSLLPDNYSSSGWIKRVASVPGSSTETLTPVERAVLYAENGVWYDALSELAKAQQERPGDAIASEEWKTLLTQVGLQEIADRAIAERL